MREKLLHLAKTRNCRFLIKQLKDNFEITVYDKNLNEIAILVVLEIDNNWLKMIEKGEILMLSELIFNS